MLCLRDRARQAFGNEHASFANLAVQFSIFRRVDNVDATGHHRCGARFERRLMGSRIDAAGEPRHDEEAVVSKLRCELPRELAAEGRSIARTHDRHSRQ